MSAEETALNNALIAAGLGWCAEGVIVSSQNQNPSAKPNAIMLRSLLSVAVSKGKTNAEIAEAYRACIEDGDPALLASLGLTL